MRGKRLHFVTDVFLRKKQFDADMSGDRMQTAIVVNLKLGKKNVLKRKKIFAVLSAVLIAVSVPCNVVMAENADCGEADWSAVSMQVIEAYVESVQNRDWSTFIESEFSGERESSRLYLADDSNTNGIKQVKEISLSNIYEVDSSVAEGELLKREYPFWLKMIRFSLILSLWTVP